MRGEIPPRPGVVEPGFELRAASFLFFFFLFLIEVYLVYNVVLISAAQQSDSVMHIYSFPLWFIMKVKWKC